MKGLATVVTLSLLCSLPAVAAPSAGTVSSPQTTTESSTKTPASPPPSSSTASPQTLFEKTLPLDIDTASYYELLAWVQRLGLSQKGSRSELQARLRSYYKLPAAGAQAAANKNARIITVKSARSADYFTLEKVGQKYIRLSGGVELVMQDPKTDTTHTILADTIVFNETEKTVTATGNIEYILTGKQKTEIFRGKSLTFNLDNWSGIFFEGVSQSQKDINKNKLTFYYTGQTIRRRGNDIVTLRDGTITSSTAVPPNYKITASRIWILAPGEWALSNAVLYLGRVPMFYFPFFFHPGDNLFFHPAIGYREEEGYYLQTTTYLLGRRSKVSSSLSFLQVAEDTNVTYNTKVRGLFLRKTTPVTAAEQSSKPYDAQNSYVRLLFDIYSRLGVFAGIQSKFVDLGIFKKLEADLTVARSRNIFLLPNGVYTAFLQQSDGTFTSLWNSSSLFGLSLPIRYGADIEIDAERPTFSVTASLPFYSDPYYQYDFSNRGESIDWSRLLGLTGSSSTTTATGLTTTPPQGITSLLWSVHSTYTPNTSALAPFVSQAAITAADMSMYWQTKTRSVTGIEGLDPNLPNYVPLSDYSDFTFPGSQFFYPQSYVLPSVSAKVAGTIFQSSGAPGVSAPPASGATSGATGSGAGAPPAATAPSRSASAAPPAPASGPTTAPTVASQTPSAASPTKPSSPAGTTAPATSAKVVLPPQPPWQEQPKQAQAPSPPPLKIPEVRPPTSISVPSSLFPYTQSLTYSITPAASITNWTVNNSWQSPADINLGDAYSVFNSRGTGALTYNGALLGTLLTVQDIVALSGNYKIHYNEVPGVTDWQSYLLQDYNATFLKATNSLTLTTFPFQGVDLLTGTNLQYSLAADLFTRTWVAGSSGPVFQNSFLQWNSTHISTHSLAATLDVSPYNQLQSLGLTFILPPLVPEVDLKAVDHLGPLTTTVTGTATRPIGSPSWQFQPLTLDGLLVPISWFTLEEQLIYDFNVPGWTQSTSTVSLFNASKSVNASETFTYDLQNHYPTDSLTNLKLWFFNVSFEAQRTNLYQFSLPTGWTQTGEVAFVPTTLSMGINYTYKSRPLWENRIHFQTGISTAWNLNLQQFTDNSLTLNLTASLSIYKFVDMQFTLQSEDRATYRYFPQFASKVGQSYINPLDDFLKSINFFNTNDRTQSNFKMKSVDFKLVHHLEDWNLNLEFTGTPELATTPQGLSYYQWNPTFTVSVDWLPVPEIKSKIVHENGQISF